jgi:transcription initiation factor TFIIIB Brf1 subunit/transcription initiation factor TFIIB
MKKKIEDKLIKCCKELKLTKKVNEQAKKILEEKDDDGTLLYKKYRNGVGGAIYIAAILKGERRTQKEVAEVVGCSAETIRNTYKLICKDVGIVLDAAMGNILYEKMGGRVDMGVMKIYAKEIEKELIKDIGEETYKKAFKKQEE